MLQLCVSWVNSIASDSTHMLDECQRPSLTVDLRGLQNCDCPLHPSEEQGSKFRGSVFCFNQGKLAYYVSSGSIFIGIRLKPIPVGKPIVVQVIKNRAEAGIKARTNLQEKYNAKLTIK